MMSLLITNRAVAARRRLTALLVAVLILPFCFANPLAAQSFTVAASSPSDGATQVPLVDTVRFEFDLPDDEHDWSVYEVLDFNTAVRVEPRDGVRLGNPQLLLNEDGEPGVITYEVRHERDADYTWLVYDVQAARPAAGGYVLQSMTEPYVLRYTTSETIGVRTVSGHLEPRAAAAASRLPASTRTQLRHWAEELRADEAEAGVAAGMSKSAPAAVRQEADATHVFLLSRFTDVPRERDVEAATVVLGDTEAFSIDHVRAGTYWPVAVRFLDAAQTQIGAMGIYDPDGDGTPDPVDVADADRADVELALYAFAPTDGVEWLDEAREVAMQESSDLTLRRVQATGQTLPDGRSYGWTYTFAAVDGTTSGSALAVEVDPLGVTSAPRSHSPFLETTRPIAELAVTGEEAAQTVLQEGGAAFLADFEPWEVQTILEAGVLPWHSPPQPDRAFWLVRYVGTNAWGTERYQRFVDLETGAIVTDTESPAGGDRLALEAAYPNPFRQQTRLAYRTRDVGPVRVAVYDLLGREVTVLVDATVMPGRHTVHWEGHSASGDRMPSGLYVVRLTTETGHRTRTVTHMR